MAEDILGVSEEVFERISQLTAQEAELERVRDLQATAETMHEQSTGRATRAAGAVLSFICSLRMDQLGDRIDNLTADTQHLPE